MKRRWKVTSNNRAKLILSMGLMMAASVDKNRDFFELSIDTQNGYSTRKIEPIKKGTTYIFEDGFECQALNKKNADRKHNNWLKARKEVKP